MNKLRNKPTKEQLMNSLPPELRPIYLQFVAEYQWHCLERYGAALVSYPVLADLIMDGWRPTHESFVELKFPRPTQTKAGKSDPHD